MGANNEIRASQLIQAKLSTVPELQNILYLLAMKQSLFKQYNNHTKTTILLGLNSKILVQFSWIRF